MANVFAFNPLTGNFDLVSDVSGFFKLDQSTPQTVTEGSTMPTFQAADADADVGLNFTVPTWDTWQTYVGGGDSPTHFRDYVIRNTTSSIDAVTIHRTGNVDLVGDLLQTKADPEQRMVDSGNSAYTRVTKSDTTNFAYRYNQVLQIAGPGTDVVFDGSNDYIAVANESNFDFERTDTFSIAAWIKCTASGVYHNIFVKANDFSGGNYAGYWFRVTPTNVVDLQLYDVNTAATDYIGRSTTDTVADGSWYFVVATYSGNSSATGIKIYINAVQKDTTNTGGGSFGTRSILNNQTPRIGGNALGGSFTGHIDEPLVFSKVLSGAEITALYNGGVGVFGDIANAPFTTNFKGGWHFDEGSGTTAADFSGNSNTGTLTNGPTWGTGIVPTADTTQEARIWASRDGILTGERGILTIGDSLGRTQIDGKTTRELIGGTEYANMNASGFKTFTAGLMSDGSSDIIQTRIQGHSTQTANLSTWENSAGTLYWSISGSGTLTANAQNIATDTTTGTKIGTATSQKLGFFNATPIVQVGATTDLGTVLSNLGFRAAGTAYPITTSGSVLLSGGLFVDGSSDIVQLRTQGHSTQTSNIQTWENSSATVLSAVSGAGFFGIGMAPHATIPFVVSKASDGTVFQAYQGANSRFSVIVSNTSPYYTKFLTGNSSVPMTFGTNQNGTNDYFLKIETNGNVGIGMNAEATVADSKLHIKGTSDIVQSKVQGYSTQTSDILSVEKSDGTVYFRTYGAGKSGVRAGTSTSYGKLGGTIFDYYADVGNIGTGEDDLYSSTCAASILNANGDKIVSQYGGIFIGDATSTQRLRAYFGGTLIFDTGALSVGVSTTNWDLAITVIRESSTVVRCSARLNTSFASLSAYASYTRITGLTLTNTQILKITGEAAGVSAATDQIIAKEGYVEWRSAA